MKKRRSVDLRQQALAALGSGVSRKQVCELFGIHRETLREWHHRAAQGSLEDRPTPGGPRKIASADEAALVQQLQAAPDATLEEHARVWREQVGPSVSPSTMRRAILRLEPARWTRKKRA